MKRRTPRPPRVKPEAAPPPKPQTHKPAKVLWCKTDNRNPGRILPPTYEGDAGFDLSVSEAISIEPGAYALVPCGIRVALPPGVSAVVIGRSSSVKRNLLCYTTLIDSGYRGDLFVFCFNLSRERIDIEVGDRIAQLLPVVNVANLLELEHVQTPMELPPSKRGQAGFGSSGR